MSICFFDVNDLNHYLLERAIGRQLNHPGDLYCGSITRKPSSSGARSNRMHGEQRLEHDAACSRADNVHHSVRRVDDEDHRLHSKCSHGLHHRARSGSLDTSGANLHDDCDISAYRNTFPS